eukprot:GDKI01031873.1.p2 GENE.GDKI01031873.1~~GDKI01031873.1.p2  ORF type:complete len:104 (+),score=31.31 GDKI01031873.1:103-414(+)
MINSIQRKNRHTQQNKKTRGITCVCGISETRSVTRMHVHKADVFDTHWYTQAIRNEISVIQQMDVCVCVCKGEEARNRSWSSVCAQKGVCTCVCFLSCVWLSV